MALALLYLTAAAALSFPPPSSYVVGSQPRGNAVVRAARRSSKEQSIGSLRHAEHLESLGMNIDHFTRSRLKEKAAKDAARAQKAANVDGQRTEAEARLQWLVKSSAACGSSNARSAAQLCRALREAQRLQCRSPQLVRKAEALLVLLERAAMEDHERSRSSREDDEFDA